MTSVLVTGANGFIGRHLVRALAAIKDVAVQPLGASFGDLSLRETWGRLPPANVLIHLAAKSSVPASWEYPPDFVQANCLGISYALEYCRQTNAKLIFLSSYMYGDAGSKAIAETAPTSTKNPYALTKHFAEQLCEIYSNSLAVDSRILRPFNVYGPQQGDTFLIPKIIQEARSVGRVHVKDLEPRRDYVYVDDLVVAIIKLIDYAGPHRIFNIGTGRSHSVQEVIQMVQVLLDRPVEILNEGVRRPSEIMDSVANIELARQELDWVPKFSLPDGLKRMIASS